MTLEEGAGKYVLDGAGKGVVKSELVEICLSLKRYVCVITTNLLAKTLAHTLVNLLQPTSPNLIHHA